MPNLIAGHPVVPELLQHDVTGPRIAAEATRLLDDASLRATTTAALTELRRQLGGGGAARKTAAIAAEMLA